MSTMNTMIDAARKRLVAEIGQDLFGQPGLNLMELAEKVRESRNSAPLGYVRAEAIKALREDDEVTGVMVHVDKRTDSVPVYLAAQPSPAGQVDRSKFEAWAKAEGLKTYIYGGYDMYSHPVTRGAWLAWQHLAARQPVVQVSPELFAAARDFYNEAVADQTVRISCASPEHRDRVTAAGERLRAALVAAPAQAVDLGELRRLSDAWLTVEQNRATDPIYGRALWACAKELRDLIDSHQTG